MMLKILSLSWVMVGLIQTSSNNGASVMVDAFAFSVAPTKKFSATRMMTTATTQTNVRPNLLKLQSSLDDEVELGHDEATQERIQELINSNAVLLFMKGSKVFPQCGFSNTAIQILNNLLQNNVNAYHTVDVLSDESIRQGIKLYSQWPTIPQLYVDGEFIGGSDIMIEMYQSGELGELLEKVQAEQM